MTEAELRRVTRRFFRRYLSASVSVPKNHGNLYELFCYTLVLDAIRGVARRLRIHTSSPGEFRFRCSPGYPITNGAMPRFRAPQGRSTSSAMEWRYLVTRT